jgi:hypothetical protein
MGFFPAAAVVLFAGYHPPTEYVFIPDTDRYVAYAWGRRVVMGKLDARRNLRVTHEGTPPDYGHRPAVLIIRFDAPTRVYEFRSGRLVLGKMMPDGNFVPEIGSAVTRFDDYRYGPGAVPIWNLPGYFRRKDLLGDRDRAKLAGRPAWEAWLLHNLPPGAVPPR